MSNKTETSKKKQLFVPIYQLMFTDEQYRSLKHREARVFLCLLAHAWRITSHGNEKWLGCLRKTGAGPYSRRELADLAGVDKHNFSADVRSFMSRKMVNEVTVDGVNYLHIVGFEGWYDGARFEVETTSAREADQTQDEVETTSLEGEGGVETTPGRGQNDLGTGSQQPRGEVETTSGRGRNDLAARAPEIAPEASSDTGSGPSSVSASGGKSDETLRYVKKQEETSSSPAGATADDDGIPVSLLKDGTAVSGEEVVSGISANSSIHGKEKGGGEADDRVVKRNGPAEITLGSYLADTVGVSRSGIDRILALGLDDLRIRKAAIFAMESARENPAAYLCRCLEDPYPRLHADADEVWAAKRKELQESIDYSMRQHGLFARESVAAELEISDADAFALDLRFETRHTLESAMVAMYLGQPAGYHDNRVLGGVEDFRGTAPVVRVLANYGIHLTRAFVAAAGVAKVRPPDELGNRIAAATAKFPEVPESFDGERIRELVATAEAAKAERQIEAKAAAEKERLRREAQEAERRLRRSPDFHPLPKDAGLILEMGEVLNERGVVPLLERYGIPVCYEFLRTLYSRARREELAEGLLRDTVRAVVEAGNTASVNRIVEATGQMAPYPKGMYHKVNSWMRYFPAGREPRAPKYRDGEMQDYRSLTDEPNEDWTTPFDLQEYEADRRLRGAKRRR